MALLQAAFSGIVIWWTSGGSPLVSDCAEALKRLEGQCRQSNGDTSYCKTQVNYGTCKIDACGQNKAQIADGVNCGGYLQTILNECHYGGRVGGFITPDDCNVNFSSGEGFNYYKLQFSHS
ncbi:hypothetical protein C8Q80DRAFT_1269865 [Daedaleopsis nitida]|nr:hypothetical protein C8Q80DRAFT_1269865 [Daedaleopsis nitida]